MTGRSAGKVAHSFAFSANEWCSLMPAPTRAEGAPFLAFCGRLGLGRRQQKTDAGGTVHSFVFDGNQPYTEFTPGFTRQAGGFYTYANGTTYFNRADNLTMPRLSTDYNGTVQRTEGVLMGPFGDNFTETLSTLDFTGFAGGFWDSENNGEHFGAREYQNTHGSWLSPDPAGLAAVDITNPQTWNRYAYVGNNPVSHIDPLGLFLIDCVWEDCFGGNSGGGPGYVDGLLQTTFNSWGLGGNATVPCLGNDCSGYGTTWKLSDTGTDYMLLVGSTTGYDPDDGDGPLGAITHSTSWADLGSVATWNSVVAGGGSHWNPDYLQLQVSIGTVVGWTGSISRDRYGKWYLSLLGGNVGKSLGVISGSITANWIASLGTPLPAEISSFMQGWSVNASGGYIAGAGATVSLWPLNISIGVGAFWPNAGISVSHCCTVPW
jgi:RHS repeat-associated protein